MADLWGMNRHYEEWTKNGAASRGKGQTQWPPTVRGRLTSLTGIWTCHPKASAVSYPDEKAAETGKILRPKWVIVFTNET